MSDDGERRQSLEKPCDSQATRLHSTGASLSHIMEGLETALTTLHQTEDDNEKLNTINSKSVSAVWIEQVLQKTLEDLQKTVGIIEADSSTESREQSEILRKKIREQDSEIEQLEKREMDLGNSYNALLNAYQDIYKQLEQLEEKEESEQSRQTARPSAPILQTYSEPITTVMTQMEELQSALGKGFPIEHKKSSLLAPASHSFESESANQLPTDSVSPDQQEQRNGGVDNEQLVRHFEAAVREHDKITETLKKLEQRLGTFRRQCQSTTAVVHPSQTDSVSLLETLDTVQKLVSADRQKNLKVFSLLSDCLSNAQQHKQQLQNVLNLEGPQQQNRCSNVPDSDSDIIGLERVNEIQPRSHSETIRCNSTKIKSGINKQHQLCENLQLEEAILKEQRTLLEQNTIEIERLRKEQESVGDGTSKMAAKIDQTCREIEAYRFKADEKQREIDTLEEKEARIKLELEAVENASTEQKQSEHDLVTRLTHLLTLKEEAMSTLREVSLSVESKEREMEEVMQKQQSEQRRIETGKKLLDETESQLALRLSDLHELTQKRESIQMALDQKTEELRMALAGNDARMEDIGELGQKQADIDSMLTAIQSPSSPDLTRSPEKMEEMPKQFQPGRYHAFVPRGREQSDICISTQNSPSDERSQRSLAATAKMDEVSPIADLEMQQQEMALQSNKSDQFKSSIVPGSKKNKSGRRHRGTYDVNELRSTLQQALNEMDVLYERVSGVSSGIASQQGPRSVISTTPWKQKQRPKEAEMQNSSSAPDSCGSLDSEPPTSTKSLSPESKGQMPTELAAVKRQLSQLATKIKEATDVSSMKDRIISDLQKQLSVAQTAKEGKRQQSWRQ